MKGGEGRRGSAGVSGSMRGVLSANQRTGDGTTPAGFAQAGGFYGGNGTQEWGRDLWIKIRAWERSGRGEVAGKNCGE